MSRTVTFILLLLICLSANAAPAGDNTVKTSFATFTLADGWRLASPQKPESKAKVTHNGITIKHKTCDIFGPKYALLLIGRYDTGKTADIDGVKDYIRKWLETDNRDNICKLEWEFDENRNMWIGTDSKITSSNSAHDNPDIKITRKDVIYLLQNGKYIDVFWQHLTMSGVYSSRIATQMETIFRSWTPKGAQN